MLSDMQESFRKTHYRNWRDIHGIPGIVYWSVGWNFYKGHFSNSIQKYKLGVKSLMQVNIAHKCVFFHYYGTTWLIKSCKTSQTFETVGAEWSTFFGKSRLPSLRKLSKNKLLVQECCAILLLFSGFWGQRGSYRKALLTRLSCKCHGQTRINC